MRRTFIFAGMDTTSNALAVTLERLGDHPDVQQKLREEVLAALEGRDDLDYDALTALPYLDAVCRETLRLHSPVTHVFREYVISCFSPPRALWAPSRLSSRVASVCLLARSACPRSCVLGIAYLA